MVSEFHWREVPRLELQLDREKSHTQTYIYFHRGVDLPAYYVIMTCHASNCLEDRKKNTPIWRFRYLFGRVFPNNNMCFFVYLCLPFWWDGCATFIRCRIHLEYLQCFFLGCLRTYHVNITTMQLWMGYYHTRISKVLLNQEHNHCMRDVFAVYEQILDGRNPANKQRESWEFPVTNYKKQLTSEQPNVFHHCASCYSSSNNPFQVIQSDVIVP